MTNALRELEPTDLGGRREHANGGGRGGRRTPRVVVQAAIAHALQRCRHILDSISNRGILVVGPEFLDEGPNLGPDGVGGGG